MVLDFESLLAKQQILSLSKFTSMHMKIIENRVIETFKMFQTASIRKGQVGKI